MRRIAFIFMILGGFVAPLFAHHLKPSTQKTMPVTTASPKARDLYERAMTDYENEYIERANVGWRAAVQADPNFALAWAWIAFNGRDPAESAAAREKAKTLAPKASPGERLMVQWIVNVQQGNSLAGIAALNDLLEMYPRDKRLFYLAGNWMMGEDGYERARAILERALAIDKDYPPALNDLAYVFAHERQFYKAIGAMDRYAEVLPGQPNPQDSYAEILRLSGNFPEALDHYHAALKIDPGFETSQLGLGDTYALMGELEKARVEYDKAIQMASTDADRLDYWLQKAMTWVREGNFDEADKALYLIADRACQQGLDREEAQAHRMMGMYAPNDAAALKHLQAAEEALNHKGNMALPERENERARILYSRVLRAVHAGNQELVTASLKKLDDMAGSSRSHTIHAAYEGASGAALAGQQKFAEAITHLEEDQDNPYSMQLLVKAYTETGVADKAHDMESRLTATYVPTMEQALVVVPLEKPAPTQAKQ